MIIIFGVGPRERKTHTGEFLCHRCDVKRTYHRKEVAQWFRLFFIPLFRVGQKREYLECTVCGRVYLDDEVKVYH